MCEGAVRTMLTVGQSGTTAQVEDGTVHAGKPAYCTGNCKRCPGRQKQSCQTLIEVERRSELRRRYNVDISAFQVDLETFGTSHTWSSVDRSSGGIGVRSDHAVEIESTYVLSRCNQTFSVGWPKSYVVNRKSVDTRSGFSGNRSSHADGPQAKASQT